MPGPLVEVFATRESPGAKSCHQLDPTALRVKESGRDPLQSFFIS